MSSWWVLLIILIVILVLWWLLRRNAQATETPKHEEEHKLEAPEAATGPSPAEVVAEVPTRTVEIKADDLKLIEGIGPKIAAILKEAGISTFAQLAASDPAKIKSILDKAGLRLADPTSWPEQAKLAAEGNQEGLKALQDQLKGGRIVK